VDDSDDSDDSDDLCKLNSAKAEELQRVVEHVRPARLRCWHLLHLFQDDPLLCSMVAYDIVCD